MGLTEDKNMTTQERSILLTIVQQAAPCLDNRLPSSREHELFKQGWEEAMRHAWGKIERLNKFGNIA